MKTLTKTSSKALLTVLIVIFAFSELKAQNPKPPLTLADILTALRSKRIEDPEEKNRLLIEAVIERGVTFNVSPEIEKELEITGASKALIEAIKLKSPSAKTETKSSPTPLVSDYRPYEERADVYVQKGEYDLAILEYNRAIDINSKEASLYVKRGFAFFNKKNFDLALADYNKAIEIDPKEAKAYFYRANLYEKDNKLEKAIEDYQKVLELEQNNEQARSNLKKLQELQAKLAPTPTPTPPQQQVASRTPVQPPINRDNNTTPRQQPQSQNQARTEQPKPQQPQPKGEPRKEESKEKEEQTTESSDTPGELIVGVGQLTSSNAISLAKPVYPLIAQRSGIEGQVKVEVTLDEEGNVISAKAVEGPNLLRAACEEAARKSKFKPIMVNDKPVKARGFIVYSFSK